MEEHGPNVDYYGYTGKPAFDAEGNLLPSRAMICKQLAEFKDSVDLAHHITGLLKLR